VVGLLLLLLFAWGPIVATRTLTGIAIIIVLALFGAEMLRRQTAREFPDAHVTAAGTGVARVAHGVPVEHSPSPTTFSPAVEPPTVPEQSVEPAPPDLGKPPTNPGEPDG